MKFIKDVPNILVNNDFEITTVQYFDEDEDTITLKIAEHIPQFVRGYVCDMVFNFQILDGKTCDDAGRYCSHIKDAVLVHVRKRVEIDSLPQFEYVFYK